MRIAVYSPYLDTAGGGEKYMLTIAEFLSKDHQVDFLLGTHLYNLDVTATLEKIKNLHGLNLSKVNFIKAPIGTGSNPTKRLSFLKKYDYLFYLGDGSIFYSTAKNNILHIQSPIKNTDSGVKGKIKLSSWKLIIYNSKFTKEVVEKFWGKPGIVVYPPVSVDEIKPLKKKKQILSVGRFFKFTNVKKQDFMINAFKKLVDKGDGKGWSLHLAGGADESNIKYVEDLKKLASGYDIFLHPNMPFSDLKTLYGESSIYWHAAGFGESDPTKMEHFGITTVEAMAGGSVPIVINLGGQKEIVDQDKSGFLWNDEKELLGFTKEVIKDPKLMEELSTVAVNKSEYFSKEKFCENIERIIS